MPLFSHENRGIFRCNCYASSPYQARTNSVASPLQVRSMNGDGTDLQRLNIGIAPKKLQGCYSLKLC